MKLKEYGNEATRLLGHRIQKPKHNEKERNLNYLFGLDTLF